MATGDQLKLFGRNLGATRSNVRDLRYKAETMEDIAGEAKQALKLAEKVEDQSNEFLTTIKSMRFSLKVVGKVGPLKVPSKLVNRVLDKLEDVTRKVRDKARQLDKKIKKSGYIEKLENVEKKLQGYQVNLYGVETKLTNYRISTTQIITGFTLIGKPVDPVESKVDKAVKPANDFLSEANGIYDAIEKEIDGVGGFLFNFRESLFRPMTSVARDFDRINSSLDFLSSPLNATYSALKPIEGVLDAVGLVYKLTVGPVVDWVLDTLGINKVMDKVSDQISSLLPDVNVLDKLQANIDGAFVEVDEFLGNLGWNTDFAKLVDKITDDVFPGIDDSAKGVMRIGTEGADQLQGRKGNDVLDPRGGDDSAFGKAGNDLIFASSGFDEVYGGKGKDRLLMNGNLNEFTFSRPDADGPVVFYHHAGEFGHELAYGIEQFVFSNGTFTWEQLRDNVKFVPGGIINGTRADEVFYANTATTPVTIKGRGGNDQLTGSEFDDVLIGGKGHDQFTSQRGADEIRGGRGRDTWIYGDNDSSNSFTTVDLANGTTWDGHSKDTLSSIENISILDNRDTQLFGNDAANTIVGNDSEDWIAGAGGNDLLDGRGGRDLLIGGPGVDKLLGGDGTDTLIAAGPVSKGQGATYEGGEGFDRLVYSTDFSEYDIKSETSEQKDSLDAVTDSGPLRINAKKGTIQHLSGNGKTVLATDKAVGIEVFIGSESDDVLFGARREDGSQLHIDGGGGNDRLYSRGATWTKGGEGNDILFAQKGGNSFDGGSGTDTLDTRKMNARWSIRLSGAIGSRIQAFEVDDIDALGSEESSASKRDTVLLSGNLKGTEIVYFGRHDDEIFLEGNERLTVYGGEGDDRLIRFTSNDGSSSGILHGESGNDYLQLNLEGELYGGSGEDELSVNASGSGHIIDGGRDNDFVSVRRMDGTLNGGLGYDTLSLEVSSKVTEVRLDLGTGLLETPGDINSIDAIVSNFEQIIGIDNKTDRITGGILGERILGRGGNDELKGQAGNDELFGGNGNDILEGGSGNDLLHGGVGWDTIRGGDGIDTVSYANAVPETERGEVAAGNFGNLYIALNHGPNGLGSGDNVFGKDNLYEIENVIGSNGNDQIIGDDNDNSLSGGNGDDILNGEGGNDILVLGQGNDTANGGSGNDTFIVDLGNLTLDGGEGSDTIDLGNLKGRFNIHLAKGTYKSTLTQQVPVWQDDRTSTARTFDGKALTPQDVLETEAIFANSTDDLSRALPAPGSTREADFIVAFKNVRRSYTGTFNSIERVIGGNGKDRLTGNAGSNRIEGGNGKDKLNGLGGNDNLIGDNGNDQLSGGKGNDILIGGKGKDQLRGGKQADRFVINGSNLGADNFLDFARRQGDKVQINARAFKGLKKGKLANAKFTSNASGIARDRNDFLVFNTSNHTLYYDRDGSGSAKAVKLAVLKNKVSLRNTDFVLS